jgi:hypothetical protein
MTISGFLKSRFTWRRRRWKYWAGVVTFTTWMLSSAHACRKRSRRAEECSGPGPRSRAAGGGRCRRALPLRLAAHDELVDDHLGAVREVAELGLPEAEHVRVVERVAVVEAEDGRLGQEGVVDAEARLIRVEVLERRVFLPGLHVGEDRVAVAEGPAFVSWPLRRTGSPRRGGSRTRAPRRSPSPRAAVLKCLRARVEEALDLGVTLKLSGSVVSP